MIKATSRNPVAERAAASAAIETLEKTFDAEVLGEAVPGVEMETTAGPGTPTTAVATVAPSGALAAVQAPSGGEFAGEWDESDIQFPTLVIAQGSGGALIERGIPVGTLVFADEELFPAPRPNQPAPVLRFVPMSVEKSYRENLSQDEYQNGTMPRSAKTKREVLENGGSLVWGPGGEKPSWGAVARCVFLLEAPKDTLHPGFGIELDGKSYAVAVYYAKGAAYKHTAKLIWNTYQTSLFVNKFDAEGKPLLVPGTNRPVKERLLSSKFWNWTWGIQKFTNFTAWYPRLTCTREDTSPTVREFIASLVSPADALSGDGE